MSKPSIAYLHECFEYVDGKLFWKVRPLEHFPDARTWNQRNSACAGKEAGSFNVAAGRHHIIVRGRHYHRSVVVWAVHNGAWSTTLIDHRDRNPANDRIGNLRMATVVQNAANTGAHRDNKSGVKGVSYVKRDGTWRADISHAGKRWWLGDFASIADAKAAYDAKHLEFHGEVSHVAEAA